MKIRVLAAVLVVTGFTFSRGAQAGFDFLPENRHHLFQSYGLFNEPQTEAYWRTPRHAWGAMGSTMALLEAPDWAWHPQLIVHAKADAAFRFNAKYNTILTETIDARVGLFFDFRVRPDLRFFFGWTHLSGHAGDDINDTSLSGPNLGDEILMLRVVHDCDEHWRVGGTFKPIIGSEPKMKILAADQFVEWFPWGQASEVSHASPYVALGGEEMGVDHLMFNTHAQLGVLFGNHFREAHHTSLRAVAGYYRGMDQRLKYAQFNLARAEWGYVGIAADL
ncbi:MAG: hypothetical protein HY074_11005 [Deltaproteobacteria bacterium]|nr:hypothetical protein [Deltaproteobacteria bacterium]